ncbi:hypothetical protein PMIN05_002980 [Paraphaeosphaeria minitans]
MTKNVKTEPWRLFAQYYNYAMSKERLLKCHGTQHDTTPIQCQPSTRSTKESRSKQTVKQEFEIHHSNELHEHQQTAQTETWHFREQIGTGRCLAAITVGTAG